VLPKTTLKIVDDIAVVVPDSLDLITPYVLREQGDWFEDEIKFVRQLLHPGEKAIDIGANYGLFTLSMARAVGAAGRIWSFEPASSTAAFLAESIGINGFTQITLDQRALSDRAGRAQLSLNENSELNELVRGSDTRGNSETVPLTTLDTAMQEHGWCDIDLVKIDAEGEEAAIIRGGRDFFQVLAPLVQYEVKAGNHVHLELVKLFQDIGYTSYRLIPGLGVLVPFDPKGQVDDYLLNLFCCKPERARTLAANGRLIQQEDLKDAKSAADLLQQLNTDGTYSWRTVLTRLPYGKQLAEHWQQAVAQGHSSDVETALALHAIAQDKAVTVTDRFIALRDSLEILVSTCDQRPDFLRLMSLGRVAREFGARKIAVMAMEILVDKAIRTGQVNPGEPFLAASQYFEIVDPEQSIGNWVVGSAMEELERNSAFSSFYTGPSARQRLEAIKGLGIGSPEMARRLALVQQRFATTPDNRRYS
jgi:FkbM family methyltransferase